MKIIFRFLKQYKLFSTALLALIVSLALELAKHSTIAHWVLGVISIIEVIALAWDMWQELRTGRYGIDILAATAIVASVLLKQYWAGMIVVIMLTGGESLEDYAEKRAQVELDSLLAHAPVMASVIRKGKTLQVPVSEIKLAEKIIIKAGDVVPVDAEIIEGQANFNEATLTGESLPELREVGSKILSGSISVDGSVTAKTVATYEDSQYQQIIKLVKGASKSDAPFVRLADRYSLSFSIMAYAIAIAVWIVSGQAIRFLEVIIVATPCPLILAAPIALISGMARASRYGIIVKSGKSLEILAQSRSIAFDKTGTLTNGELSVKAVKSFAEYEDREVLGLAASLEQNSNHVLAQALITDAKLKNIKLIKAKHIEEVAGLGLKAIIKGKLVMVGSLKLIQEADIKMPAGFKHSSINTTAAYVASGDELIGVISFTDELRAQSKETIERLHALGISNVTMITGDNQEAAAAIAKQLSIKEFYAGALPADKLHILAKLKPKPVIFVGDGINDAPVLTSASVGIALGAKGSTAASESADMVIMLDDVSRVAVATEIAKKTFKIARQSILIGIGLSLFLMLVFASGSFKPIYGAIAQEVVDVFVIFNALRAHAIKPLMVDE
jgi:heavy metal translocating P-type ATPase